MQSTIVCTNPELQKQGTRSCLDRSSHTFAQILPQVPHWQDNSETVLEAEQAGKACISTLEAGLEAKTNARTKFVFVGTAPQLAGLLSEMKGLKSTEVTGGPSTSKQAMQAFAQYLIH
jgi:hypothetical protein